MGDTEKQIKDAIITMATLLKKEADNRFYKNNGSITFEYNLPIKKITGISVNSKIEIACFKKNGSVSLYKIILKIDSVLKMDSDNSGTANIAGFRNDDKTNKNINFFYENLFLKDNVINLEIDDYIIAVENMYDILPKLTFDSSLRKFTTELCIPITSLGILFSHDNIDNN
jgi:hypothetical protein